MGGLPEDVKKLQRGRTQAGKRTDLFSMQDLKGQVRSKGKRKGKTDWLGKKRAERASFPKRDTREGKIYSEKRGRTFETSRNYRGNLAAGTEKRRVQLDGGKGETGGQNKHL